MSKKQDTDYRKLCIFCENATILQGESDILCKHKGIVAEDFVCRKFVYDPLKRTPKAPMELPKLDKNDLI